MLTSCDRLGSELLRGKFQASSWAVSPEPPSWGMPQKVVVCEWGRPRPLDHGESCNGGTSKSSRDTGPAFPTPRPPDAALLAPDDPLVTEHVGDAGGESKLMSSAPLSLPPPPP